MGRTPLVKFLAIVEPKLRMYPDPERLGKQWLAAKVP